MSAAQYVDRYITSPDFIALALVFFFSATFLQFGDRPILDWADETLGASAAEIAAIRYSRSLPYMLRILFGVVPEIMPIGTRRYKPYLILGVVMSCVANTAVAVKTNTSNDAGGFQVTVTFLCVVLFIGAVGDALATLIAGLMIVEHSIEFENKHLRGIFQCSVLISHFSGKVSGGLGSISVVSNEFFFYKASVSKVYGFMAAASALLLAPNLYTLRPVSPPHPDAVALEFNDHAFSEEVRHRLRAKVRDLSQSRVTLQLCALLYAIALCQIGNPALATFYAASLSYGTRDVEILDILGNVASMATVAIYQTCCETANTRDRSKFLLVVGIMLTGLVNFTLLASLNNGTTDLIFFQDGIVVSMITVISYAGRALQLCVLYTYFIGICDKNRGFTTIFYTAFTSILIFGASASKAVGAGAMNVWDVSHTTLSMHDYSGFRYLTLFSSMLPVLPAALVLVFLPRPYKLNSPSSGGGSGDFSAAALAAFFAAALVVAVSCLKVSAYLAGEYP